MTVYTTAGNLAGPPWAALMGEYIPPRKRGAFFGFRNQTVGLTFFAASLLAGVSALWAAPLELTPEPPPEVERW
jgi:MFS family permease